MPESLSQLINRLLRDHEGYTGDGQGNEGALPIGDPSTRRQPIDKRDVRQILHAMNAAVDQALDSNDPRRPFVMLAFGQSNMAGFSDSTNGDKSSDPGVYFWNNTGSGAINTGSQYNVASFGTPPLTIGSPGSYANNIAFHAAKRVRLITGRPVYVILVARGAQRIECFIQSSVNASNGWTRDGGLDLYTMMANNLTPALAAVPGSPGQVDAILVHQGEANRNDPPELYARKLKAALVGLEELGVAHRARTSVICGEVAAGGGDDPNHTRHRSGLRRLKDAYNFDKWRGMKIVSSQGLPVISSGNVHFTGEGLEALGRAYAEAIFTTQPDAEYGYDQTDFSVDGSLIWSTRFEWHQVKHYAGRHPAALDFPDTGTEENSDLGWAYTIEANQSFLRGHRFISRVPLNGVITIEYEIVAKTATAVPHRPFIWCYDRNRNFLSSSVGTPGSSPVVAADGLTFVSQTFKRDGSSVSAQITLPAGTRYFAPGVWIGGDPSGPAAFNIIDMRIS